MRACTTLTYTKRLSCIALTFLLAAGATAPWASEGEMKASPNEKRTKRFQRRPSRPGAREDFRHSISSIDWQNSRAAFR